MKPLTNAERSQNTVGGWPSENFGRSGTLTVNGPASVERLAPAQCDFHCPPEPS